jgi:polyhydroxybutyrate depolymerase
MENAKATFLNFKFKRLAVLVLVAVAAIGLLSRHSSGKDRKAAPTAAELSALGLTELSLNVNGVERWFLVQPPRDASKPAPILVVLHGGTQSMRRMFVPSAGASLGWPDLARRENAVLIVPNAVNAKTGDAKSDDQNWNDLRENVSRDSSADDVGFILALLDWAASQYNTDPSKVYVTGASNGGMMTFRLLIEAPERFSAAAAFVAALPVESSLIKQPSKPTPLMIANGTVDPLLKYNGGKIPGGRGKMRSVPDTITWWLSANRADTDNVKVQRLKDLDPNDGCIIERRYHNPKPGGAAVLMYTMIGGGHNIASSKYSLPDTWLVRRLIGPVCRDAEGIELIWSFLSAYKN